MARNDEWHDAQLLQEHCGRFGLGRIGPLPALMRDGSRLHFCPGRYRLSLGKLDAAGAASP